MVAWHEDMVSGDACHSDTHAYIFWENLGIHVCTLPSAWNGRHPTFMAVLVNLHESHASKQSNLCMATWQMRGKKILMDIG